MEIKNIAIIAGNSATVKNGHIKFMPSIVDPKNKEVVDDKESHFVDRADFRSDANFSSGKLEFTLRCKSYDTSVLVVLHTIEGKKVTCGYNRLWGTFLIAIQEGKDLKKLSTGGKLDNYELDTEIRFQISIKGSQIDLLINNIVLCSANISVKDSPIEFATASTGEFDLYNIVKHSSKPRAFVVMQFSKEYDDLYEEVIRPVTEKYGYECIRADEYYTGTPILNDIIKSIKDSSIVIAEITPDNPNVFYEIGYSHAIGKPTILLCDKIRDKLPFDISSFRTLFYENTIAGKKKVENSLMKYLENV